ncbi:MAG: hypothetical protein FWE45_02755 [Firmicutes bacterium]|nr:hypothetical protein [Bacillota bacterium]
MKHLYMTLTIIFGVIGIITLILSFIEFSRDGLAGLYLILFSLTYLSIAGIFTWLFIRLIKSKKSSQ